MSKDHFPPADPEYSMNLPEPAKPEPKYPGFAELSRLDKLEVLTDEMVYRDKNEPMEIMLKRCGIEFDDYKAIIADGDYIKLLRDKSTREKFAPEIPHIFETVANDAVNGDSSQIKSALQIIGSIVPEGTTLVNGNLINMTDNELKIEIEKLARSLDEQEK